MVPLVFVPGVLSLTSGWLQVVPEGARLAPVDYRPEHTTLHPSGSFGDFVGIMALRSLTTALLLGQAGPWAIGVHSAGGPVLYHLLDLLADLQDPGAVDELLRSSQRALSAGDFAEMALAVEGMQGKPAPLPVAAFSFEGSLMPCDVLGWAEEWAEMPDPPKDDWAQKALKDPNSHWTWNMVRRCSSSLVARCSCDPPRGLASIERWLRLPGSPGLVYVAGEKSEDRNRLVFPALENIANRSTSHAPLRIIKVPGAGHNLNRDDPHAVRDILAKELGLLSAGAHSYPPAAFNMNTAVVV